MKVTNLILDPRMMKRSNWAALSMSMSAPNLVLDTPSLRVTATADAGSTGQSWVKTDVKTIVGQRYVFSAYLAQSDASGFPMNRVLVAAGPNILGSALFDKLDKRYTMEFVAESGTTSLRFYAPSVNGETAMYGAPICALKSEYEYLTSKIGLVYFDYTTMPLER